ncbi:MAG: phage holin family protein [Patescibacteria group bacterium]
MKSIIRNVLIYSLALFALSEIISGVEISGGLPTFVLGGAVLSIMFIVVKPVLNLVTLPLNILTLGLFSFFSNIILLFLLTLVVLDIKVSPFVFPGFSYSGFVLPRTELNQIFAFIVSGLLLSGIITVLTWLIKK